MKFDLHLILDHFCVEGSTLYRKFAAGNIKRVQAVEAGRLVAMIAGRKYYGPEIAWACHYGAVPEYRIVTIDTDPHNLAKDNLGAARRRRLIFQLREVPGGHKHPLNPRPFSTAERAKEDWVLKAREHYNRDLQFVLLTQVRYNAVLEQEREAQLAVARERVPASGQRGPKKGAPKPEKPQSIMGRRWHWYKDQWVSVPLPVHPSDDWMVRAEAVLRDPDVRFVYDQAVDMTRPVWSRV